MHEVAKAQAMERRVSRVGRGIRTRKLTESYNSRRYTCPTDFSFQQEDADGKLDYTGPYGVQFLNSEVDSLHISGHNAHRGCLLRLRKLDVERMPIDDVDQRAADQNDTPVQQMPIVAIKDL